MKERIEKLQKFVDTVNAIFRANNTNPKTKKGKSMLTAMFCVEYNHNRDTVIYIAALRCSLEEVTDFINKNKNY